MGISPVEVGRMSLFQYMAAVEGYAAAHDPEGQNKLSGQEEDELWSWLKSKE